MTSIKQIEANRCNSLKSTGPKTEAGKRASRCNAVRHGLTAETVIGALEDAEDYKAFEASITADYDAQSAVERELVLRLSSLLWRLRRATTIETGLFEIQADHLSDFRRTHQISPTSRQIIYALFNANSDRQAAAHSVANSTETRPASRLTSVKGQIACDVELARCFLRLCHLPNYALDRLSRYEAALWRQAGQILLRSTIWIAASHRRESGVLVSKHSQASGAKRVEGSTASRPSYIQIIVLRRPNCGASRHSGTRAGFDKVNCILQHG
jgi:hypothetical protein